MKFLLVDDSSTMRKVVGLALRSAGFEFNEADSGANALKIMDEEKYDYFLVDLNMPEMNGIELIKKIREKPNYEETPIIVITTETDENLKKEALEAGANDIIAKPFQKDELIELINKYD